MMTIELPKNLPTSPGDASDVFTVNGHSYRIRIEYDYDSSINDYDSDGKFAGPYDYIRDGRRVQRPEGFDGRAVKLDTDQGCWVWWQPCPDAIYPTKEDFEKDKRRIADLIRFGFIGIIVERVDGSDHYGNAIVRDSASLWSIEYDIFWDTDPQQTAYAAEIVGELINELEENMSRNQETINHG